MVHFICSRTSYGTVPYGNQLAAGGFYYGKSHLYIKKSEYIDKNIGRI